MLEFIRKQANKILWVAILLQTVLFSGLSLRKYNNFDYNVFDLAIFNQVFYNSVSGRLFDLSFNLHTYLADHFTPIIIFLLPFYYFISRPETLLILQSFILALCAWPIYVIGYKVLKNKTVSLGIVFLWLINFIVHSGNLFEWHLLPLAVFFIFWSFYFYQQKNFKWWLVFFILTLLVREDMVWPLLGFLPLAILEKRSKKWIISPLLGLIYFIFAIGIISFFNAGATNKFLVYYSWLGGDSWLSVLWAWLSHPMAFLAHIFSFNSLFNTFIILLSVALLSLFSLRYLWLLALAWLQLVLTAGGINSLVYSMHYGLIFLPALFIATIFSIAKIMSADKFMGRDLIVKNKNFFLVLLVFSMLYLAVFLSPVKNIIFYQEDTFLKSNKNFFISQIPTGASLISSANLAPVLSNRQYIYPLQYAYFGRGQFYLENFDVPEIDYILMDTEDMLAVLSYWRQSKLFWQNHFNNLVPDDFRNYLEDYQLVLAKNNLLLWQNRKISSASLDLPLYNLAEDKNYEGQSLVAGSNYQILEDNNYNILTIAYQKQYAKDKDYLLRFYGPDYYFDVPLDYGLWPAADWSSDKPNNFYYYLSKDIASYQIFAWSGEVILGDRRQAEIDLALEEVSSKVYIK